MSFPRKRESRTQTKDWIPTYVGMTGYMEAFSGEPSCPFGAQRGMNIVAKNPINWVTTNHVCSCPIYRAQGAFSDEKSRNNRLGPFS